MSLLRYALIAAIAVAFGSAYADAAAEPELLTKEEKADGFKPLFNGKNLDGFYVRGANKKAFLVEDGVLVVTGEKDGDWLFTNDEYDNFILRYEYRIPELKGESMGNSGVGIRAPAEGNPADKGMEIQVIKPGWEVPYQRSCALYHTVPPAVEADKPVGEWNSVEVMCDGPRIRTTLNGKLLYDIQTTDYTTEKIGPKDWCIPIDDRPMKGHIGFQDHHDLVHFRNIRVQTLPAADVKPAAGK